MRYPVETRHRKVRVVTCAILQMLQQFISFNVYIIKNVYDKFILVLL